MKLVAKNKNKPADLSLRDDPRVRDVGIFNRIKLMVFHEATHPAWGCPLYLMHHQGFITTEQREVGDEYQRVVRDCDRWDEIIDLDILPIDERQLWERRIENRKDRRAGLWAAFGPARHVIDWLVLEEGHLTEREKHVARDGLIRAETFLRLGNKARTVKLQSMIG